MSEEIRALEREYEELILDVLAQDYELRVRKADDPLERRRKNLATLDFDYRYGKSGRKGKVIVTIEGIGDFSQSLTFDFSSASALEQSAEDCEALAIQLTQLFGEREDDLLYASAADDNRYGRREDDASLGES